METAIEVLQLIHENSSSLSEQRTVILHQKITLNEKLKLVQGRKSSNNYQTKTSWRRLKQQTFFEDKVKFVIA